ncbi:unnamed protein product [Periconia digitata]|uniref:Uncharacterized protein n=1 Tax=Periconia digitata TaxID=1303443 RepID=A0A9W4UMB9_9PLEO|nr:unnamed protein product [Periconia digitata]
MCACVCAYTANRKTYKLSSTIILKYIKSSNAHHHHLFLFLLKRTSTQHKHKYINPPLLPFLFFFPLCTNVQRVIDLPKLFLLKLMCWSCVWRHKNMIALLSCVLSFFFLV